MVDELQQEQPILIPVVKPFSLIPVGLKEAALDSPTFRATALHFSEQIDVLEKWLENYVKAATKLNHEVSVLEGLANAFLTASNPPNLLSEAVLDHDYSMLALRRYGEGAREFWAHTFGGIKKAERSMLDPIKAFLNSELRSFRETRRLLDQTQRHFDYLLARFSGQVKSKEPSSLREDAFQLHEARKVYLKCSMDFCIVAPQLRASIDTLLIKVFTEQWLEMKDSRSSTSDLFTKYGYEVDRIRSWSQEVGRGSRVLKRELQTARKQIEESAEQASRPSRELEDYAVSTVPFIGTGLTAPNLATDSNKQATFAKQGWLFLRTVTGKPTRINWIRRWFFVKNGIFGWLNQGYKSGGVEESEKIGVLLCSIRPAFQEERRFCFEVKTKDTTIILQAETQSDLSEWISAFEIAKQLALEDSTSSDAPGTSGNPTADAAYAVSPAIAPELAAKGFDGQITNINEDVCGPDRSGTLSIPEMDGALLGHRNSFDVGSAHRSDGESGRDHAARILQKLDLHRKGGTSPQLSGSTIPLNPAPPTGGIASLIAASHSALPVGPGRPRPAPMQDTWSIGGDGIAASTLSPATFVNPPSATNLSRTALFVSSDRGLDLGVVDNTGGVPSGLMANQWGSANYGHLSRIDRGEVKPSRNYLEPEQTNLSNRSSPQRSIRDPFDGGSDDAMQSIDETQIDSLPSSSAPSPLPVHRKTVSQISGLNRVKRTVSGFSDFPGYYPAALRAQDAQFRMLFPNVPTEERVVLVFRASWNPNELQDLPGRVYVTSQEMLFYSHHQGLVMVSGVSLSNISEVAASSGKECDYITVFLKDHDRRDDTGRIRIKTFLESVKLLHTRLSYLVSNCNSDNPKSLEEVLKHLIGLETQDFPRRSSTESWDELSVGSPADELRRDLDGMSGIRVDRTYFNDFHEPRGPDGVSRFKLPTQPVEYTPQDVDRLICEKTFNISAKALFHVMFGDQSAVFQILYRARRADILTQYPWTKNDQGLYGRSFEYKVDSGRHSVTIVDSQVVDLANDHLCYEITDRKTPWHLPYYQDFILLSEIVITHVSKSKCKLAIFTKVQWLRQPYFFRRLLENHALEELDTDALEVAEVVSDQVEKLGPNTPTRKAIQIFGYIGQYTDVTQITTSEAPILADRQTRRFQIRHRTLFNLLTESAATFGKSALSMLVMSIFAFFRSLSKIFSTHALLLAVLIASLSTQLWWASDAATDLWRDRTAAHFMGSMGVAPNPSISKAVYLADLESLFTPAPLAVHAADGTLFNATSAADRPCLGTFRTALAQSDASAPRGPPGTWRASDATHKSALRLRRARQNLASYRHDLLVAMRLVNSVERETVRAEWENWVAGEGARCEQMKAMLKAKGRAENGGGALSESNGDGGGDEEDVRSWFEDYCRSCQAELESVTSGGLGNVL